MALCRSAYWFRPSRRLCCARFVDAARACAACDIGCGPVVSDRIDRCGCAAAACVTAGATVATIVFDRCCGRSSTRIVNPIGEVRSDAESEKLPLREVDAEETDELDADDMAELGVLDSDDSADSACEDAKLSICPPSAPRAGRAIDSDRSRCSTCASTSISFSSSICFCLRANPGGGMTTPSALVATTDAAGRFVRGGIGIGIDARSRHDTGISG